MAFLGSSTHDNAVIAYFYNATGITTLWEKQDELRPNLPYISLSVMNIEDETGHMPDRNYAAVDEMSYTFRNLATIRARIFCNTDIYMGYMRDAVRYRKRTDGKLLLQAAGMNIRSVGDIVDISAMIDTSFELKATCDFVFAFKEIDVESMQIIKTVRGEFNDAPFEQDIYIET